MKTKILTRKSESVANVDIILVASAQGDTPSADVLVPRDARDGRGVDTILAASHATIPPLANVSSLLVAEDLGVGSVSLEAFGDWRVNAEKTRRRRRWVGRRSEGGLQASVVFKDSTRTAPTHWLPRSSSSSSCPLLPRRYTLPRCCPPRPRSSPPRHPSTSHLESAAPACERV
jgi:hypothetical protein